MRAALDAIAAALEEGRDAVGPDFQFHLEIARATQNAHFAELMGSLGTMIIPRARLDGAPEISDEQRLYLRRVNAEHESIFDAIRNQDSDAARAAMRTHLANSRERRRRAAQGGCLAALPMAIMLYDDYRLKIQARTARRHPMRENRLRTLWRKTRLPSTAGWPCPTASAPRSWPTRDGTR